MKNIFLIGFMGCGKSAIARYMFCNHGFEIVEMDEEIETREQMAIPQIFAAKGERYFRDVETKLLFEIPNDSGKVVSCGGGVILREENVNEMKRKGIVVWLTARPETILERVKNDDNRPLLHGNKNVDAISEMIEVRRPNYQKAADVMIQTDEKSLKEICSEILEKMK